jgi:tRNA(Ile)-lysidine synthase
MGTRRKAPLVMAVARFLDGPHGPARGSHGLVGVSGGPDSTALALALGELRSSRGLGITLAHVDHGVRGTAGERDAAHVRMLAGQTESGYLERHIDIEPGPNLEARARRARYRALREMASQAGASWIGLAHTKDDQAETVLMRLLRGAGRRGLGGMRPARGRVLRPLLEVGRADVRWYLGARGVRGLEDPSNADLRQTRNRIRQLLIPLLEREFDPRIIDRLASLADRLRDEDSLLNGLATTRAEELEHAGTLACVVAHEPVALARRIIQAWLEQVSGRGVGARHVAAVLAVAHGERGGIVAVPGPGHVARENERLVWRPGPGNVAAGFAVPVRPGAAVDGPTASWRIVFGLPEPWHDAIPLPVNPREALFDEDCLEGPLLLRSPRAGDRIRLRGVGTRKLQDVLVDRKVPRTRRHLVPVLCAGPQLLWVAGIARSEVGLVQPGTTRRIVRARLERSEVFGLLEENHCGTVKSER